MRSRPKSAQGRLDASATHVSRGERNITRQIRENRQRKFCNNVYKDFRVV